MLQPGRGPVSQGVAGEVGTQVPTCDLSAGPTQQRESTPRDTLLGAHGWRPLWGPPLRPSLSALSPQTPARHSARTLEHACWPPVPPASLASAGLAFAVVLALQPPVPPNVFLFPFLGIVADPQEVAKRLRSCLTHPPPFPAVTSSSRETAKSGLAPAWPTDLIQTSPALCIVLISLGCCDKMPQTGAGGPRSRCRPLPLLARTLPGWQTAVLLLCPHRGREVASPGVSSIRRSPR